VLQGLGTLAVLRQQLSQVDVGLGVVGLAAHGGAERPDGSRPVAEAPEAVAEVVMGHRVIGLEPGRFPEGRCGAGDLPPAEQGHPQVEVPLDQPGLQRHRLAERALGRPVVLQPDDRPPQGQPHPRRVGVVARRLPQQGNRLGHALLVEQAVRAGQPGLAPPPELFELVAVRVGPGRGVGQSLGQAQLTAGRPGVAAPLVDLGQEEVGLLCRAGVAGRATEVGQALVQPAPGQGQAPQHQEGARVVRVPGQEAAQVLLGLVELLQRQQRLGELEARRLRRVRAQPRGTPEGGDGRDRVGLE
jgi:hypothetical protein